ncbi:hypothetical protein B0A50_07325 [Salinomyces thailandicus]|uniref:SET domain-containing protein n=1 Tax=Salinomyces thailandicus TaxID=706561 RepID=A0A4U0TMR1_9PEZI|nr:hypothetical protein B0A50_07325 [Salinomyces thailandica]
MNELRRSDMLATMWAQSGDSGSAYMSASNAENDGLATSTEQAGQETFKALATEKNPTTNMETKDCDSEDRHALIKNAGDDHVTGPPESGAGLQIPGSGSAHAPASVRSPLHAHNDAHRAAYPLQHDMSNDRDTPDAQKVAAVKKSPAMDVVDCRANEHAAETTMEAQHPTTAPEMPATSDVRTHSRDRNEAEDRLAGFGIWREEDGDKVVALRTDDEGENQPFAAMSSAKQVEAVVGKHLEEQRSDNERQNRELLKQARLSVNNQPRHTKTSAKTKSTFSFANLKPLPLPPTCEDSRQSGAGSSAKAKNSFSFANLKPLKLLPDDKASRQSGAVKMISETFHPGGKSTKKTLVVQPTIITPKDDMPEYSYAVSIRNNFLAPNSTTLQHWPYFGDNFDYDEVEGLGEQYSLDVKDRPLKLLRLSQAEKYHPYADAALRELGLEWEDVIAFLLEAHPDVGNDPDALRALERRSESTAEEFCREHKRTAKVLSVLQPSTPDKLGKAAMLCDFFHKMAGLSLWHVARKYLFRSTPKDPVSDGNTLLDEMTCRVCLRFACPYHGEIEEWQESDDSDEEEGSNTEKKKRAITTDIVNPPNVNHRTRVAFSSYTDLPSAQDSDISIRKERRTLHYWEKNYKHSAEDRGPFYPCHHPGQSCRECDPDLCATCGVVEVLDPPNRYRDDLFNGRCRNAGIQLGVPKFTLLGNSGVHGFGLYVGEDVKQHEFVGEYKGEVITKNEAERRGAVYKHQKLSYLFSLNATQEIDSTYFGNKTRYINHAGPGKFNLYPRILLVNTVHRIALFAKRNITKGEELLFDYGPQFPDEELGGKSAYQPHVRNSDVVQQFWEVEHAEDATGLRRARKAAKSAVKGRSRKVEDGADGKVDKRRGGARGAGAGRKKTRVEATKLEDDDQRAQADDHISAGDRLAAFNVIDETGDDGVIMDVVQGAEEDEDDFEPEESGGEVSDESDESGAMLKRPAARGRQARRGNTGRKIK